MRQLTKHFLLGVTLLFFLATLISLWSAEREDVATLSIDILATRIAAGEVRAIEVQGSELSVTFADGAKGTAEKEAELGLTETLKNYGVSDEALRAVSLTVKGEGGAAYWFGVILPTFLPLLLMLAIFWWIFRQAKTGASQAFSFGKITPRLFSAARDRVTFKDVAGLKETKEELEEVVDFLRHPKKFLEIGARIPRGVLLMGPPGTGKTLLARAVAGESNAPFFHLSASEFVEMFVGVGASVSGDTPVLVRSENGARLTAIASVVDAYYADGESDRVKKVSGLQTLGFKSLNSGFRGESKGGKQFFGGSAWTNVQGVYRHKADALYVIKYLGGEIRTTGDHSIFVRSHNMIVEKKASELKGGDVLVNLPFRVRGAYISGIGTLHSTRAHQFQKQAPAVFDIYGEDELRARAAHAFALVNKSAMTQREIAAKLGVQQMTISNWQSGKHVPRLLSLPIVGVVPREIQSSPELMRLAGYYAAEGRTTAHYTQFVFGLHEKSLHDDCVALVRKLLHLEPNLCPLPDMNAIRITVYSAAIARFFEKQCGTGSKNKHIPEHLWTASKEEFLAFLEGYSRGDGYHTAEGKLSITSVSRQMIRELSWLCAMHGIQAGVRQTHAPARVIRAGGKETAASVSWNLIIGKSANPFKKYIGTADQFKRPVVESVKKIPYDGYVYDFCGCEGEAFFGGEKPLLLHNSRVRDLFQTAKKAAPSIIFIDEIDAVGRERGAGLGGGHDEREQTLNQILVEMDGFERDSNVIVMAATNRPDILDSALLRPGRFDRRVVLDMPDIADREAILRIHAKGKPLEANANLKTVAIRTPGFSGADLANLMNEAAISAARENRKTVKETDILDSIEKVMLGPARRSRIISPKEKEITAYHEAGHALVAASLKDADPVHKISIVSRGMAGGYTLKLPTEERRLRTKSQFLADLAVAFGGYAAESLVFKDISTGSSNDIRQATDVAHQLVTRYGMSDRLGPRAFGKSHELIFLGRELSGDKDYSESVGTMIDEEVNKVIAKALQTAKAVVAKHKDALGRIAKTLMEKETIERAEFDRMVRGFRLKPIALTTF